MDDKDNHKKPESFEASLPLPASGQAKAAKDDQGLAAELIRKKVASAYAQEPDAQAEKDDISTVGTPAKLSRHQQFIVDLTSSGKPLHDIQSEWHEYYQTLSDTEKHQVWQEFYSTHAQASRFSANLPTLAPKSAQIARKPIPQAGRPTDQELKKLKRPPPLSLKQGLHSLVFGISMGCLVLLILLFSFFNERFIAPFIQPSRHINNIPLISGTTVSDDPEIIIPKINVEIPVVYDVNTIDDHAVETALEDGVVHYADTALPGQNGNLVIVGHSSNNILNPGKYKFAFVLLSRLDNGDTFYIQKDGKRYTYQVYKKVVVKPDDVSVLGQADRPATASLITCDPPGTSLNRLVVTGEQISPDPASNIAANATNSLATSAKIIPGNSPSLWSRLWSWL